MISYTLRCVTISIALKRYFLIGAKHMKIMSQFGFHILKDKASRFSKTAIRRRQARTGLGAKPIIDIMVGLSCLSDVTDCIGPPKRISYEYVSEYEASIPERRFFRKGLSDMPNQHFYLHMVERISDFWKRHILFRGFLHAHPDVAQHYFQLKSSPRNTVRTKLH
jgi:GrpB-like predicted nucleotidyltransferase (UPF0157 family)